jgi:hypothetical protein
MYYLMIALEKTQRSNYLEDQAGPKFATARNLDDQPSAGDKMNDIPQFENFLRIMENARGGGLRNNIFPTELWIG